MVLKYGEPSQEQLHVQRRLCLAMGAVPSDSSPGTWATGMVPIPRLYVQSGRHASLSVAKQESWLRLQMHYSDTESSGGKHFSRQGICGKRPFL